MEILKVFSPDAEEEVGGLEEIGLWSLMKGKMDRKKGNASVDVSRRPVHFADQKTTTWERR